MNPGSGGMAAFSSCSSLGCAFVPICCSWPGEISMFSIYMSLSNYADCISWQELYIKWSICDLPTTKILSGTYISNFSWKFPGRAQWSCLSVSLPARKGHINDSSRVLNKKWLYRQLRCVSALAFYGLFQLYSPQIQGKDPALRLFSRDSKHSTSEK